MDTQRWTLRVCAAAIFLAVGVRLLGALPWEALGAALETDKAASFLFYLETGRLLQLPEPTEATPPPETVPETQPTMALTFTQADAALVRLRNYAEYDPDLPALLTQPLTWQLVSDAPTVLILHSHGTESYTPSGEPYTESSDYRTLDKGYNMVSIGAYLAQLLEAAGIQVIHDTATHDYPSYNGSYISSRAAVQAYLEKYPTIRLVLDLHRDAADTEGGQLRTEATVEGQASAQLMMVVGTNASGKNHPNWQENLALALKLHVQLEKLYPGLCRKISFRKQRFNQDLSPGAMLIEVGAAGNTRAEALVATQALAQGIIALANGTE